MSIDKDNIKKAVQNVWVRIAVSLIGAVISAYIAVSIAVASLEYKVDALTDTLLEQKQIYLLYHSRLERSEDQLIAIATKLNPIIEQVNKNSHKIAEGEKETARLTGTIDTLKELVKERD